VDHPIKKRKGRDEAFLGLPNHEKPVRAWLVGFPDQMVLDIDQVGLQVQGKPDGVRLVSLAAAGLDIGPVHVLECADALV